MPAHKRIKMTVEEASATDPAVLLRLEDIINMALRSSDKQPMVVNFKLIQTVLTILARQMRVLDQQVELGTADDGQTKAYDDETKKKLKQKGKPEKPAMTTEPDKDKGKSESEKSKPDKTKADKTKTDKPEPDELEPDKTGTDKSEPKSMHAESGKAKRENVHFSKAKKTKSVTTESAGQSETPAKKSKSGISQNAEESEPAAKKSKSGISQNAGQEPAASRKSSGISVTGKILEIDDSAQPTAGIVGSIDGVTQEQFRRLQATVDALKEKSPSHQPAPSMPDDEQLRANLKDGTASITDTMQALQLAKRVEAAEKSISQIAEMLTSLAAESTLPDEVTKEAKELQTQLKLLKGDMARIGPGNISKTSQGGVSKSSQGGISKMSHYDVDKDDDDDPAETNRSTGAKATKHPSRTGKSTTDAFSTSYSSSAYNQGSEGKSTPASNVAPPAPVFDCVTRAELYEALKDAQREITKSAAAEIDKTSRELDKALHNAKTIGEKMNAITVLDRRMDALYSIVADYHEQLMGFGTGVDVQILGCKEQMIQLRFQLRAALTEVESMDKNADSAALQALFELYNGLLSDFDVIRRDEEYLKARQTENAEQFEILTSRLEIMREMKIDYDEINDGLRDKVDKCSVSHLVSQQEYKESEDDIFNKLEMCYNKFAKQETIWQMLVEDYTALLKTKVEKDELEAAQEDVERQLAELYTNTRKIITLLGDPKATILCRKLKFKKGLEGIVPCTAVSTGAFPTVTSTKEDDDAALTTPGKHVQCMSKKPDDKLHWCTHYCGGSHTLLPKGAPRQQASAIAPVQPVSRSLAPGTDGKMYHLEEHLLPCEECNQISKGSPVSSKLDVISSVEENERPWKRHVISLPAEPKRLSKREVISLPGEAEHLSKHDVVFLPGETLPEILEEASPKIGAGDSVTSYHQPGKISATPSIAGQQNYVAMVLTIPPSHPISVEVPVPVKVRHKRGAIGNIVQGTVKKTEEQAAVRAAILQEIHRVSISLTPPDSKEGVRASTKETKALYQPPTRTHDDVLSMLSRQIGNM